jgi:hypothetical protein
VRERSRGSSRPRPQRGLAPNSLRKDSRRLGASPQTRRRRPRRSSRRSRRARGPRTEQAGAAQAHLRGKGSPPRSSANGVRANVVRPTKLKPEGRARPPGPPRSPPRSPPRGRSKKAPARLNRPPQDGVEGSVPPAWKAANGPAPPVAKPHPALDPRRVPPRPPRRSLVPPPRCRRRPPRLRRRPPRQCPPAQRPPLPRPWRR